MSDQFKISDWVRVAARGLTPPFEGAVIRMDLDFDFYLIRDARGRVFEREAAELTLLARAGVPVRRAA